MASYQRVALYILFDAIEEDLASHLARLPEETLIIPEDQLKKALERATRKGIGPDEIAQKEILFYLDLGDKIALIQSSRHHMDISARDYFARVYAALEKSIPIRNAVMHGRPLTINEYVVGFAVAAELLRTPLYWPRLARDYFEYSSDPQAFVRQAVLMLDEEPPSETLNNLPPPDYDDTGFLPRPKLEKQLKSKILGRHPVITVIGEGGSGKTALALQTLYGLLQSNDHGFDAIAWVSAKSAQLNISEIARINGAISTALGAFEAVADQFEPGDAPPIERVRKLLEENKILLVIDNLETILDLSIQEFAQDVPGESKLLLTSRVPLGADLQVHVGNFTADEANTYLRRLIDAYEIHNLRIMDPETLKKHSERLGRKPLLLKWFALGVQSGLSPDRITANPEMALQFCMENVFTRLSTSTRDVASILSSLPSPVSSSVLGYVAEFSAEQVETALAELIRFSLVDRVVTADYEHVYQVKPFSKAYLSRVMRTQPRHMTDLISRFRTVEGLYQQERAAGNHNRYDFRTFCVRNRSEAVAISSLRVALNEAGREEFGRCEQIIASLKISNPDYFEVYLGEAYIAYKMKDVFRTKGAYDRAVECDPDQPKIFFFYAGFLMRAFQDYDKAAEYYDKALKIDAGRPEILREAARNHLYRHDFSSAQDLISEVQAQPINRLRDETVIADLQIQIYVRHVESLVSSGDLKGARQKLETLDKYLLRLDKKICDDKLVDHLRKALPLIQSMSRNILFSQDVGLRNLAQSIESFRPAMNFDNERERQASSIVVAAQRVGHLKQEGLKPTFGFLRDAAGTDTHVLRDNVGEGVWAAMCRGEAVRYQIQQDKFGRTTAKSVQLI
jgi:LuxR family glucitol operon transcriptional activator